MADPSASPAPRTPSSSASGTPSSASVSGGRSWEERKGVSLQSIAESLGRRAATAQEASADVGAAQARHRQLNFDADSVADGDEEENNNEEENDNTPEATQELPEESEEEKEPEGSGNEDDPKEGSFNPEETESSSEDDPADETFVPDSEENAEEATVTESEASAESDSPVRSRARARARADPPPRHPRSRPSGRRRTVWWTQEEVDFLRNGVRERGLGAWKKILLDGRGIFDSHRTNVDLKDKWMNLIKRYGEDVVLGEAEIDATVRARLTTTRQGSTSRDAGSSPSSSKRKRRDSTDSDGFSDASARQVRPRTQRRGSVNANANSDAGDAAGFSSSTDEANIQSDPWMTLKIATDDSFPEFVSATVNLSTCVDVRALKRRICVKLLPRVSPDTDAPKRIQLISINSRRLLGNNELLSRCLREDGAELYVIPGSP